MSLTQDELRDIFENNRRMLADLEAEDRRDRALGRAGIDYKTASGPIEVKRTKAGKYRMTAYASTWDVDLDRERFAPGAYQDSIAAQRGRFPLLYAHRWDKPLGWTASAVEDSKGLLITGDLVSTKLADDVFELYQAGLANQMSVGFKRKEQHRDRDVTVIAVADLVEASILLNPANPYTEVMDLSPKSIDKAELAAILDKAKRGLAEEEARRKGEARRLYADFRRVQAEIALGEAKRLKADFDRFQRRYPVGVKR